MMAMFKSAHTNGQNQQHTSDYIRLLLQMLGIALGVLHW